MEILANDQQLRSLANIFTYYYPQSKCSIIIATSDLEKNGFLQTEFEQKNHCIELCNSNASILKAIQNRVVDVLIINNDYNSMEGIKLLEEIRNTDQQLSVIFIDKDYHEDYDKDYDEDGNRAKIRLPARTRSRYSRRFWIVERKDLYRWLTRLPTSAPSAGIASPYAPPTRSARGKTDM